MSEASEAPWRVGFAADAINDLLLISDHLIQAYQGFGESPEEASRHACRAHRRHHQRGGTPGHSPPAG
jgi:hypothetical protein